MRKVAIILAVLLLATAVCAYQSGSSFERHLRKGHKSAKPLRIHKLKNRKARDEEAEAEADAQFFSFLTNLFSGGSSSTTPSTTSSTPSSSTGSLFSGFSWPWSSGSSTTATTPSTSYTPTSTSSGTKTYEVTGNGVRVRSTPCTSGAIVATVNAGTRFTYTGSTQSGCGYTWYSVSGSAGRGYIASSFVREVSGSSTTSSTPTTSFPTTTTFPTTSFPTTSTSSSSSGSCRTRSYPTFKQCGQSYSNNIMGSKTICDVGCAISSISMGLSGTGRSVNGQAANPGTLNAYLKSAGGYSGNSIVWSAIDRLGMRYEGKKYSQADIKNAICANKVVILNVNHGGHWVLATGVSGSSYTVNDPGYSKSSYGFNEVTQAAVYSA